MGEKGGVVASGTSVDVDNCGPALGADSEEVGEGGCATEGCCAGIMVEVGGAEAVVLVSMGSMLVVNVV